jgi:hypothetical protein
MKKTMNQHLVINPPNDQSTRLLFCVDCKLKEMKHMALGFT